MHTMLWKIIRYVLWVLLLTISSLLLIWLAKHEWNTSEYIKALNNRNWNDVLEKWSVSYMFWWDEELVDDEENLNGDIVGDLTWDVEEWLDVFDPSMEDDLNNITNEVEQVEEDSDFWFLGDWSEPEVVTWDSKIQLLEQFNK